MRQINPIGYTPKPLRILHVVHQLARGGVETWLLGLAGHINRGRYQIDVMVHTDEPQPYDVQMQKLGCRILPCLKPSQPWRYAVNFIRICNEYGPYDIIHTHVHFWNGIVLTLARIADIPVRLAHSRVQADVADQNGGLFRSAYRRFMRQLIWRHATGGFAVSCQAAAGLFGSDWKCQNRCQILRSGIDLAPFERPEPAELPGTLHASVKGTVICCIARFDPQKNHSFLIDVFEAIALRDKSVRFMLIGSGPLEGQMKRRVATLPIRDRVLFLGDRADVPSLLFHETDLLLLTSLFEGLPRVLLEAQAAGVPVLVADTVTPEAQVVPQLVHWASLSQDPATWADRATQILRHPTTLSRAAALTKMRASEFNLVANVRETERIYQECVAGKAVIDASEKRHRW